MRKSTKTLIILILAFIMAIMPILPMTKPLIVVAESPAPIQEEQEFIPIREAFEDLNEDNTIEITWNRTERNIHINFDGIHIVFTPGSNVVYVDDIDFDMEYAIFLENGVSYIYYQDFIMVLEVVFIMYLVSQVNVDDGGFKLYMTSEEARDLVLYDLDYLVNVILENSPWESVINRRFDFTFEEHIAYLRNIVEQMDALMFLMTLEEIEEMYGMPLYEMWFPIRDGDDPRYNAATFLAYLLMYGMIEFEGIGHLFPRELYMYRIQYSGWRIFDHQFGIDRDADPNSAMIYDTLTHQDVRWFYGPVEVDLNATMESVFPEVPGNVETEIIVPGEIAYLRIHSFTTSADYDDLVIAPFFEEIMDYDHLIIDIRSNGGGFMINFTHNIMGRLISDPVEVTDYQFFSSGDLAVAAMDALVASIQHRFDSVVNNSINRWYTIDVLPAREFITARGMTYFNQSDLAQLEYVMVERNWVFPTGDNLTFEGKVWLLVDEHTGSASSQATLMLMETGLATVVGENTSGVMAAHHVYVIMPNTGLLFRMDVGYKTDALGNSLEVYGISPDIRNFFGMDALETVLEVIAGHEPPIRFDLSRWDNISSNEVDLSDHPLIGTWAWDGDDSYIYDLRPDGTGVRGFDGMRYEINWYVHGDNLFIDSGFMIEHWMFTIEDGVLTIVSAQVYGISWHGNQLSSIAIELLLLKSLYEKPIQHTNVHRRSRNNSRTQRVHL